jgi:spore coat protein A, manganese oxidase
MPAARATPADDQLSTDTGRSRRSLLRLALAGAGALGTGHVLDRIGALEANHHGAVLQKGVGGVINEESPVQGPAVPKFTRDLVVPQVLRPTSTGNGVDSYDLDLRVSTAQILPPPFPPTEVWAYNGVVPGPTIRQTRGGNRTVVTARNSLPAGHPFSLHLHGSPSQPFFDGHPDDLTPPGGSKTYRYPNNQPARTLWYHDHALHQTAEHVYKGMAGFFLHDPGPAEVAEFGLDALPSGKYDVPLLITDMQFDQRGRVTYDDEGHDSLWGNVNVVNGIAFPRLRVDRTRYRFRMLVASVSRGFNFQLSNRQAMTIIGSDAGLMPAPVTVTSFRHGMAERYDVVVDFSRLPVGTTVTLLNTAADGDMKQVLQFVVDGPEVASRPVPSRLSSVGFPREADVVATRRFRFDRSNGLWTINGLPWDDTVAATPRIGTTEKWILENNSGGWFHPVHIHLVDFQILRRNDAPPLPYEGGLKDVAYVGTNETVEVLMHFEEPDRIDPAHPTTGAYVMHCHNLVHEDHDMMNQFETRPDAAGSSVGAAGHGAAHAGGGAQPAMMVQWELRA